MELYSLEFAIFLVALLAVYYGVGRLFKRGQWIVLLVASLVFYCLVGTWKTLYLMVGTALVTWAAGIFFAKANKTYKELSKPLKDRAQKKAIKAKYARRKQIVFWLALLICFGILSYLKYWNVILANLGFASSPTSLGLLLPLGISFYTFQSVAYLIDTYNGKYEPQSNFAKHLLFVSFFPQIIQGPINRYDQLGEQLFAHHSFKDVDASRAFILFGYGLFKKVAVADMLVNVINVLFTDIPESIPGSAVVVGILLYSAYQYADFSGGIDMVEGISELLGVEMAQNFRQPYFSTSLADFWRRWHITLGAWMRDYVFYPFALTKPMQNASKSLTKRIGKHLGRTLPACLANILVFFIVGLWHGADMHYIAWGIYNGVVIALADLCSPLFEKLTKALHIKREAGGYHVFAVIRTFIVVNIGWYFDRIYDFGDCLLCLRNTVTNFAPEQLIPFLKTTTLGWNDYGQIAIALAACLIIFCISLAKERGIDVKGRILGLNPILRFVIYTLLGLITLVAFTMMAGKGVGGFMYANF